MKLSKLLKFLLMCALPVMLDDDEGGGEASNVRTQEEIEAVRAANNNARVSALDAIALQADSLRQDEFMDVNDDDTTAPFVVQTAEDPNNPVALTDPNAEALAIEQAEAAATGQAPVAATGLLKIKVNGVEVDLTPELIAKAQKVASADELIKQAAALRNQAANTNPVVKTEPEQAVDLVALTRAIQMGTEEEALEAVKKLMKPTGPSIDDIAGVIDDKMNFNAAIKAYREEFTDIISDPILNKLVIDKDLELVKAGDTRPYAERFTALGNEVREWKAKITGTAKPVEKPTAAPTVVTAPSKLVRKELASNVPATASARTNSAPKEEKEPTTQEIIAEMAARRGGSQAFMNAPKIN